MNIVILDGYTANPGDLSWDAVSALGNLTVYDRTSPEQVVERAAEAEMVLVNKIAMTAEVIKSLPRLKYIGELATGYNNIDIEAARERGITVTNIPAYSTDSVAQMVFAHILNVTNRVDHYAQQNREGRWASCKDFCYWDAPISSLAGKTLGIVGLGNIGAKVARIAIDFGMDVFAYTSKDSAALPRGIQKTTLDGLFAVSDILTLHCPLTDNTREMINHVSLMKMKPGTILVNTGRGPLINEADVADALQSGQLGAYCADVMTHEPPEAYNPLFSQERAFITPHIAWASVEARQRLIAIAAANVKAFVEGRKENVIG